MEFFFSSFYFLSKQLEWNDNTSGRDDRVVYAVVTNSPTKIVSNALVFFSSLLSPGFKFIDDINLLDLNKLYTAHNSRPMTYNLFDAAYFFCLLSKTHVLSLWHGIIRLSRIPVKFNIWAIRSKFFFILLKIVEILENKHCFWIGWWTRFGHSKFLKSSIVWLFYWIAEKKNILEWTTWFWTLNHSIYFTSRACIKLALAHNKHDCSW